MAVSFRSLHSLFVPLAILTIGAQIFSLDRLAQEPLLGLSDREGIIQVIHKGGPAEKAGLRGGDQILAVDGTRVRFPYSASDLLKREGARPHILYLRRGAAGLTLELTPNPPQKEDVAWNLTMAGIVLGTLLMGLIVYLKKQRSVTLTFFGICYGIGILILPPHLPRQETVLLINAVLTDLVSAFLPALFVHFFLLFPARRSILARNPFLVWILYLPSFTLFGLAQITHHVQYFLDIDTIRLSIALGMAADILFMTGIALSLGLFIHAFRRMKIPSLRRRIHVTFIGTLLGITPTLIVYSLHTALPGHTIPGDRWAVVTFIFIPASFGYAIIRHGVFEIDRLIRRSLAVTLLIALVVIIYFGIYTILQGSLPKLTGTPGLTPSLVALILVLVLFSPIRGRFQRLLDRDLPLSPASSDRTAMEFGRRIRSVTIWEELVAEIVDGLSQHLNARSGLLFLPDADGNRLKLSYASGIKLGLLGRFNLSVRVLQAVSSLGSSIVRDDLDAELPFGWLDEKDRLALDQADSRLLVALQGKDRPLGLILLGPRMDGGSYEGWQLGFLDDLAEQGAVALENALFHREAVREVKLKNDLEIAHSLQSSLLPRCPPVIPNAELSGKTIPCQDVGGDYYDFLTPDPEHLILSLGDVSGKGVPGALLMANLQAIFRAEASHTFDPVQLLQRVNRRVCEIRRPDRFISLFCATYEISSRVLRYASAGHPPALVMLKDGTMRRLDLSGLLLGIQPDAEYYEGRISLSSGDLLLSYSDGAIEREGPMGMLGEEGMVKALSRHRQLSARDLLNRLFDEIRYHSAQPLQDDTTLLILKAL
ncbi:MAG: SpoIIE family protein phosphatase [Candidatus Eisenbacteria bacterium]|uniref:SpoIIE family protein phosphatase n=1 Tax=Eiseniibacteriota bacterium TaxID=2212470 RepID=A0A948WEP4_UNCEI|nr:SpoIIE family protein phosphatase [Candidatus Eisenbacteria bacterium]MBU1949321.1 SpoIIE family protein phosphatase [Candidatus Eisenbacteria bacterium]MBU2692948.1 SpoIIE family protein phosphatase [Candidatus Eisenbacteria bacterium]